MKGKLTWKHLNGIIDIFSKIPPILDERGKELPRDKMWLVADSKISKKQRALITENYGIEFRNAVIDGKTHLMSGL